MDNLAFYPDEISPPWIATKIDKSRDQIDTKAENSIENFYNANLDFKSPLHYNSSEVSWNTCKKKERFKNILLFIFKLIILIFLLYVFLLSLSFLTIGFTLISPYALKTGKAVNFLLKNPIGSLAIGILTTAIMQNATATTSIVVTMVGAGIIPSVKSAVPIIMGSNIGTCLTNIFIALTLSGNPIEFRRGFSAAVINDFFNILTTAVLLPLEISFNLLSFIAEKLTELIPNNNEYIKNVNFLASILNPVVDLFIILDQDQINNLNKGSNTTQIALRCCDTKKQHQNNTGLCNECSYWCMPMLKLIGDGGTGLFWIIFSLTVHLMCLFGIVKTFSQLIEGSIAQSIRKMMNASLPGQWKLFNGLLLFMFSLALTLIVQSLDIITATLVPLCGKGIVSLHRAYVITLGSNVGTTITGVLSALTQPGINFKKSLQIAFVYTFFNLFGTLFWFPIPLLRIPKTLAQKFGNIIFKFHWLVYIYASLVYFIVPLIVFALALIPYWIGLAIFFFPIAILACYYLVVLILRGLIPQRMPEKLKSFAWLPKWMRSINYWDSLIENIKFWKSNNASQFSLDNKDNSKHDICQDLPEIVRKFSEIESIVREP